MVVVSSVSNNNESLSSFVSPSCYDGLLVARILCRDLHIILYYYDVRCY